MNRNDENESMKTEDQKRMIEASMSSDWTISTKKKRLRANLNKQEWNKYDSNSYFKKMTAYWRYELQNLKNVSRQKKKMIISQFKRFTIVSRKSLMM
jgi:hypothetical protein